MDLSETARYKPSINIAQAPRITAPLLYMGTGYGFFILAAIGVIVLGRPIALGRAGDPHVIMAIHFFTLGFLSMTAQGILTQWIPVVFDVPPLSFRRTVFHFLVYLTGVIVFAWGLMFDDWRVLALSGGILAVAIVLWSMALWGQMTRSEKVQVSVYRGIQGAILGFNATWVLGLFMALSFLGWWPEYQVLRVHIATALGSWLGLLVLSVQLKLNPMFSMSKSERTRSVIPIVLGGVGTLMVWASLLTSSLVMRFGAVVWMGAVLGSIAQLVRTVRRGKAFDWVFVGVGTAWVLLLVSSVLEIWLNPLAVIMAFWGFLILIFSYQSRIIPFMVALVVSNKLPGPAFKAFFLAQMMYSPRQPIVVAVLGVTGALLSLIGWDGHYSAMVSASGVVALGLLATQVINIVVAIGHASKAREAKA
ncbi:hypothetical protein SAMN00768000_1104 [Sulfobacillus thermosulfidooxidans DSM 9293]|uniref:Uncharacterized protein n=1 Tax=Sulfobacillus thermosulfidooxidans (strain DSM 9293 / VKM B-1269 / AT-1) TaxID=929705 RepID=A0A1W1WB99_SULTA|nr:hypothetical protein [Sulfobacillus thermosulfidooxidans]SMC03472.1 hypothetical protein SAMN00768000_1104 [Sulfobacillus thermosulfidooxidans DSM 9293]